MTRFGFPPALPAGRGYDVVGLGANAADHLVTIDRHPQAGEKVRFRDYRYQGGGQTATALVTVARLGYRACYVGGVGDDLDGQRNVAALNEEGVCTEHIRVRAGGLTQRAFILIEAATGERTIVWGRSEGMVVSAAEVDETVISSGRILHTDAQDPRAAARAARAAHEAKAIVCADLECVREGLDEFLPEIDILIAAESFLEAATGSRDPSVALRMLASRCGGIVMATRGAAGAVVWMDGRAVEFPGYAIDAVDTTGAGDVFHGAFAVACLRGMALDEAVDFSHAVAAMKCLAIGGREGIPREWESIAAFRRATPHRVGGRSA